MTELIHILCVIVGYEAGGFIYRLGKRVLFPKTRAQKKWATKHQAAYEAWKSGKPFKEIDHILSDK